MIAYLSYNQLNYNNNKYENIYKKNYSLKHSNVTYYKNVNDIYV